MNPFPDFADFFRAVWGHDPFPWQTRLATQCADDSWPEWITLPTGTGKTTTIDIAIYNLARQAERPSNERTAPVRIVFAVNRRIVVDEASERAKTIATKLSIACGCHRNEDFDNTDYHLTEAQAAVLKPVATALQKLAGTYDDGGPPLETYPLRGATFTDHSWARTPTQPLVLTTTLDQLGSRLLFRGYGVSPYARPIHAALLTNDALLILDEAHTATPFSQTLESISELRKKAQDPIPRPFASVQLTATPPSDVTKPFALDHDDHAHKIIRARLCSSKPAELIEVPGATGKSARHKKMAEAMAEKAISLLMEGHPRVLIVVNRIATAEALKARLDPLKGKKDHEADVHFLTGRLRPLDREGLVDQLTSKYHLKSSASGADFPKLILIATQCIEVGADYDFDALLTELAPLDSLRQRFGRLNRQGRNIPAPAAIFAPEEALDATKPDPLYDTCLPAVWTWLTNSKNPDARVDFGLNAMHKLIQRIEDIDQLLASKADAPILLEPHLDLFCQTSPEPHVSPDPSLYIHGPKLSFPEVSVILRTDLAGSPNPVEMLKTAPPIGTEAATVPLLHAREWLEKPEKTSDPGGDAPDAFPELSRGGYVSVENAFRWNAGEAARLVSTRELRSGDVLVLPAQTPREWLNQLFPMPTTAAQLRESDERKQPFLLDQYEHAHLLSRDRLSIRFHSGIRNELELQLTEADRESFRKITAPLFVHDEEENRWIFHEADWINTIPSLSAFLAEHLPEGHPLKKVWTHAAFTKGGNPRPASDWKAAPYSTGTTEGAIFINLSRIGATPWPFDPDDLGRQGNGSNLPEALDVHSPAVSDRAKANAAGLSANLEQTLGDSGSWHDLGKLDPRFQALLHGCSVWALGTKEALAKSGRRTQAMEKRLRERSGLPSGFRHELLSTLIVSQSEVIHSHPEPDLLLHLIASHHGRCRAMAPAIHDSSPEPFDVLIDGKTLRFAGQDYPLAHIDSGVASRFWALTRRFGWWGLPYLETLLRLADQYESARPSPRIQ